MKVLIMNCSPVRNGATAEIVNIVTACLEKKHDVKNICIDDYDIKYCKGCRTCHNTAKCVQNDDVDRIIEQYEWADIVISVSPSYWADVPGQFKSFIDRCTPWCNTHEPHAKMFYKLGLSTYYGPNFICDLGEIADEMLPYTKRAFESYLEGNESDEITSSDTWYEEREDFSRVAIGTERKTHKEERGFELLQGSEIFQGGLLGGCLESLYDVLTNSRYEDEKEVCERYDLFPNKEEWIGKILFIETCEEKPTPELFEREVLLLKEKGVFDVVNGILVGKPQDEAYYQEYKDILIRVIDNEKLPIVYNVNFGHAMPRCALQYGAVAKVDMKQKKIYVNR